MSVKDQGRPTAEVTVFITSFSAELRFALQNWKFLTETSLVTTSEQVPFPWELGLINSWREAETMRLRLVQAKEQGAHRQIFVSEWIAIDMT